MEKFVVDERIKDQFELYRNICDYLSEDYDSNFEQPAELSKIEQWEADNDTQLPYQYKSWLRLTSRALLLDGYIKFIWPMIGTLEEENDVVIIGARVGVEEEFGIERSSGIVYSICDGEKTEYDDFDDFLGNLEYSMSEVAEEIFGEDWADDFNEKYGY